MFTVGPPALLIPLENIKHLHNGILWIYVSRYTSCGEHDKASLLRSYCLVQGYSQGCSNGRQYEAVESRQTDKNKIVPKSQNPSGAG